MRNVLVAVDTRDIKFCVGLIQKDHQLNYGEYIANCIDPDSEVIYSKLAYGTCSNASSMRGFQGLLKVLGFNVKFKAPITYKRGDETVLRWITTYTDMTIDIIDIASTGKIDKVVLGCSQPEMTPLVDWLQKRGIEVVVFSAGVSKGLKDVANKVQDLGDSKYKNLITPSTRKESDEN